MEISQEKVRTIENFYTAEQRRDIRQMILYELEVRIRTYEAFYNPKPDSAVSKKRTLTKERYAHFEAWLGECTRLQQNPADIDQGQWQQDLHEIMEGYAALQRLTQGGPLDTKLLAYCQMHQISPGELFLSDAEVPDWTVLPSPSSLRTTFNLSYVGHDYQEGRPLQDFALTEMDLSKLGRRLNSSLLRESILQSMSKEQRAEIAPIGRFIFVKDLIAECGPDHPDRIETDEALELIHKQALRPATLQELLAYAAKYWRSNKHHTHHIYALGSVISSSHEMFVPELRHTRDNGVDACELKSAAYDTLWDEHDCFLVFETR